MKLEKIKQLSNQYKVVKQVYDDKILLRTNNVIYSKKYNSYMILLSNNSCIWAWTSKVLEIMINIDYKDFEETYLVELTKEDFNRIKTYENDFEGFNITNTIDTFEKAKKIAEEQEKEELYIKVL